MKSKELWKDIIYKNGKLNEEQVLKELDDFYFLIQEVPKVYCEITGGALSKLMYSADTVLSYFKDLFYDKSVTQEDVGDMLCGCSDINELKKELTDYFDLVIKE